MKKQNKLNQGGGQKSMETIQEILSAFPIPPDAPTGTGAFCGVLQPRPVAVLFDVYGTLVKAVTGDLSDQAAVRADPESFEKTAKRFGMDPKLGARWMEQFFNEVHGMMILRIRVPTDREEDSVRR